MMFVAVAPPDRNDLISMAKGTGHGKVRMQLFFQLIEINKK